MNRVSGLGRTLTFRTGQTPYAIPDALPAVLLGLLAPLLITLFLNIESIAESGHAIKIYLIMLFVLASAAYTISLFETPETTSISAEPAKQRMILERTGPLTRTLLEIPFSKISAVRIEVRRDKDGFEISVPVIELANRETLPLPAGTTDADIAAMRAMISG